MSETELVIEGVRLMFIGMGIVFLFLLLMIAVLRGMSALAIRLTPDPIAATAAPSMPASAESDELVAVIAAAIARYRTR